MSKRVNTARAILIAFGAALIPAAYAAGQETTSIKRDAESAKTLAEPSYQTREERLKAKPLDWNATIGKPKRKTPTAAERKAMEKSKGAKGETSEGGAPDPKADEEARRLHPEEWKTPEK